MSAANIRVLLWIIYGLGVATGVLIGALAWL